MKWTVAVLLAVFASLSPSVGLAGEADSVCEGACVTNEDMAVLLALAEEAKCLRTTAPDVTLDEITIVTDEKGRVFHSGAEPRPYRLTIDWCNLTVEGEGHVDVLVSKTEPQDWGFRFRPKAFVGIYPVLAFEDVTTSIDAGVLLDVFHIDAFAFNANIGFRGAGIGLTADLTENFGVFGGVSYLFAGGGFAPMGALWFSF
jgi:hypothetical protein